MIFNLSSLFIYILSLSTETIPGVSSVQNDNDSVSIEIIPSSTVTAPFVPITTPYLSLSALVSLSWFNVILPWFTVIILLSPITVPATSLLGLE